MRLKLKKKITTLDAKLFEYCVDQTKRLQYSSCYRKTKNFYYTGPLSRPRKNGPIIRVLTRFVLTSVLMRWPAAGPFAAFRGRRLNSCLAFCAISTRV